MALVKRILKGLGALVIVLVAADVALVFGIANIRPDIKEADAIVILGAAINSPALYNRSIEGMELYQEGKGRVLVLSGGRISDKDISEAEYMQKVIRKNSTGIPLILEEYSHNTYENFKNTRAKIPEAKSLVVVSDKFHLARAVLLAKRNGFEKVYWSSPEPTYYGRSEIAFYYFRELVAMIDYIPRFIWN